MSEQWMPTTDDFRQVWAAFNGYGGLVTRPHSASMDEGYDEFDRWLAGVRAEARREGQVEALRAAANTDDPDHDTEVALGGGDYVRAWLHDRSDQIETEEDS